MAALRCAQLGLKTACVDDWRGPNGNGSTSAGTYPVRWDVARVAWKAALPGKSGSTPVVHDGRIYLTCPADGQDAVLAFDFTGRRLWQTTLGAESQAKHRSLGSSANASPVTDGQRLYVYFRSGHFAALEFDGSIRWKINLVERFGRDQVFWDQGSSPMLTAHQVVMLRLHQGESWLQSRQVAVSSLA